MSYPHLSMAIKGRWKNKGKVYSRSMQTLNGQVRTRSIGINLYVKGRHEIFLQRHVRRSSTFLLVCSLVIWLNAASFYLPYLLTEVKIIVSSNSLPDKIVYSPASTYLCYDLIFFGPSILKKLRKRGHIRQKKSVILIHGSSFKNTCMFSKTIQEVHIKCPSFLHSVHIHDSATSKNQTHKRKLSVLLHKSQPAEDPLQSSFFSMSYVVYVILFLSLHACNGRSLGLYTEKGDFFGMDVHNSNLHSPLATSTLQHFGTEELQSLENHNVEIGQSKISQTPPSAVSVKGMPSEETLNQKITKEWRRQALSTSGSVAQDVEEPADSNAKDITEDVVVMDYAQPHRKPPIHNTKD